MKQLILACTFLSVFMGMKAVEYDLPTLTDNTTLTGTYSPVGNPVAYGTDGTIYQTGLYDDMIMLGDDILEPIATSAYLCAINMTTQKVKWAIGIQGAARITAITTSADGIYVTGIFADDILLGSKDMQTKEYTGTELSHDKVNGFVAKYSLDGNLLAAQSIIPHRNAKYGDYDSDLMVYPTSIALYDSRVYLAMTFMGGYVVENLSKDGNVKSSFGYWDSKCADVVSLSVDELADAACVYDIRNTAEVNTDGYAPSSICLTANERNLYIGVFTAGSTTETLVSGETTNFDKGENGNTYYFLLQCFNNQEPATRSTTEISPSQKMICNVTSDRLYINNVIRKMYMTDQGKLYLAGCVSTPLPLNAACVPDLWCDEFAACLTLTDNNAKVDWAVITGAKQDAMPNTNAKYRETTDAALSQGKFIVVGSSNFCVDTDGRTQDYSSDYCLGIADNGASLALTTKTDKGSKLTFTTYSTSVTAPTSPATVSTDGYYDLAGHRLSGRDCHATYLHAGKKVLNRK